jgi:hypothetical protein
MAAIEWMLFMSWGDKKLIFFSIADLKSCCFRQRWQKQVSNQPSNDADCNEEDRFIGLCELCAVC